MSNLYAILDKIADEKIRKAMENGEFDNLEGKRKPLKLEDDSHLPPDIRMAHKILKNAGCLPEELELRKEIHTMEEMLAGMEDTQEKYRQMKKLNLLILKLNMTRQTSIDLEENQIYYEKILGKLEKKTRTGE